MEIDLKDPSEPSLESVAKLLASKDDSRHRQLRITKEGIAFISDDIGNINTEGLAFRFEIWEANKGYCGTGASKDPKWVKKVYTQLSANWPTPKSTYIDF